MGASAAMKSATAPETVAHSALALCRTRHGEPANEGSRLTACKVSAVAVSDEDMSSDAACAVLAGGQIECWGTNWAGELGDGKTKPSATPVFVKGIDDATAVSVGSNHACAVLSTGGIDCWGAGGDGELGNDTDFGKGLERCEGPEACSTTPVAVDGITDATAVAAGTDNTCALLTTGGVECWGGDYFGDIGRPVNPKGASRVPVAVAGITNATAISAKGWVVCVLLSSGGVDCWGYNYEGELGDRRTETSSPTPAPVSGVAEATAISVSVTDACALLSTGAVDCWGSNWAGALGHGAASGPERCRSFRGEVLGCSRVAVAVKGLSDATAVAAGESHTCALRSTDHVVCWGSGGALGAGKTSVPETCKGNHVTFPCSTVPVAVRHLKDAIAIAAGAQTCAVLSSGHVDCWGTASYRGELPVEERDVPVPVSGLG
jgi:alpha-tubulin suppressor-like RCC1 family protein